MEDMKKQLEQINQRLNSVLKDQALIYAKMEQIEMMIKAPSSPGQE